MPRKKRLLNGFLKKKKGELMPPTIVECKSGSFIAYYEHRTDIIANGENEKEAKRNLKELYSMVQEHESNPSFKLTANLPSSFNAKVSCN